MQHGDWTNALPKGRLTRAQRGLVTSLVQEAVAEYIRQTEDKRVDPGKNGMEPRDHEMGFLRLSQILEIIPVGKTTWWKGVKSGRFPKPMKLSERCTAWSAQDIRQLATRMSGQHPKE
jgi:prophage regulatory protein